jgi:hypothetical protein
MLSDDDSIGGIAQERWRTAARRVTDTDTDTTNGRPK